MEQKYFVCKHCGNIVEMVKDKGVPIMCCGQKMTELVPNTTDASGEKHVPIYKVQDGIVHVTVGAAGHPMMEEHSIEWVSIQTKAGGQRKTLKVGAPPEVSFALCEGDKVEAVYSYCNLHGLWKA